MYIGEIVVDIFTSHVLALSVALGLWRAVHSTQTRNDGAHTKVTRPFLCCWCHLANTNERSMHAVFSRVYIKLPTQVSNTSTSASILFIFHLVGLYQTNNTCEETQFVVVATNHSRLIFAMLWGGHWTHCRLALIHV